MSEKSSEAQLADKARTDLLEAISRAAEVGNGETAHQLAQAYVLVNDSAPSDVQQSPTSYQYVDNRSAGRR